MPEAPDISKILAKPLEVQLAWVDAFDLEVLRSLHDANLFNSTAGQPILSEVVHARILERLAPKRGEDGSEGYWEGATDAELRASLTPQALLEFRRSSYDRDLVPFLTSEETAQVRFLDSLSLPELITLLTLIGRYARERGADQNTASTKALILARIPKHPKDRKGLLEREEQILAEN